MLNIERAKMSHKSATCSLCEQSFSLRKNLYRHLRTVHDVDPATVDNSQMKKEKTSRSDRSALWEKSKSDAKVTVVKTSSAVCCVCDKGFSTAFSLRRHMDEMHGIEKGRENKSNISCPLCQGTFHQSIEQHLISFHELELSVTELTFSSMEEFCAWKEATEAETVSQFIKHEGSKKVQDGTRCYFHCHRSGMSRKMPEPEKIRRKESPKIESYCPARITTTEHEDGGVSVTYQSKHVGHDLDVGHL